MSAAPAFLQNVDEQEYDDLAQLVGQLEGPTGDAEVDAVASIGLREMAREQAEIDRYKESCKAELSRIQNRYVALVEPHIRRYDQAEGIVKECASRAQFVGKSKSRKVGNGQYGRRTVPEKVKIIDVGKALEWARTNCPAAIKQKTEESVVHAIVAPLILARLESAGELPDGFEHEGEHEEMYAKPLAVEGE